MSFLAILSLLSASFMGLAHAETTTTIAGQGKTQTGSDCEFEVEISGNLEGKKKKEDLKIIYRTNLTGGGYLSLDRPRDELIEFSKSPLRVRAKARESGWSTDGFLGVPRRYWLQGKFDLKELTNGNVEVRASMKGSQVDRPFDDVCLVDRTNVRTRETR
jgi:hypothetical protein